MVENRAYRIASAPLLAHPHALSDPRAPWHAPSPLAVWWAGTGGGATRMMTTTVIEGRHATVFRDVEESGSFSSSSLSPRR